MAVGHGSLGSRLVRENVAPVAIFTDLRVIQMAENKSATGLTDDEAKEFHAIFTSSMLSFFGIVVVAHMLVWAWRPWL